MSGVNIKVRADARQAQDQLRNLNKTMGNLDKQARSMTSTFQKLALGIGAAFAAGGLVKGLNRAADSMTDMSNRVNLVTRDMKQTTIVMDRLFKIAARSRSDVGAAADTFSRFGLALRDQNKPLKELLIVTEAVQKAGVISGSSSESAKAAIVQLGQGLASGQLRGQELNSVLEQMPRLAQAIAKGMDIPFGKLRESAMAGKVTAEAVYAAILKGAEDIDKEYLTLKATVGGLGAVFKNEFTRAVSELDKVVGATALIKKAIVLATNSVRSFGANIGRYAAIARIEFLVLQGTIKYFAEDTFDLLKGIFSGDIDPSALTEKLNAAYQSAKSSLASSGAIAIEFTTKKIDLIKDMLPNMDSVKRKVSAFAGAIEGIFKWLHGKIVLTPWWTSMWADSKKKAGQLLAIGSSLKAYTDVPLNEIIAFGKKIIEKFREIHASVTETWGNTVALFKDGGLKAVIDVQVKPSSLAALDSLSNKFTEITGGLDNLLAKYDEFAATVSAKIGLEVPDSATISTAVSDTKASLEITVENSAAKAIAAFGVAADIIKGTTAFQVGRIVIESTIDFGKQQTKEIDDFIKAIKDNEDRIAAALAIAITIGAKVGFKKAFISGLVLFNANDILNDADFQSSVNKLGRGLGQLISDVLAGESSNIGERFVKGLTDTVQGLGKSVLEGLFGADVKYDPFGDIVDETTTAEVIAETLIGGVVTALGLLSVSSKVRGAAALAGAGISKAISLGGSKLTGGVLAAGAATGGLFAGMAISDYVGYEPNDWEALGIQMAGAVAAGFAAEWLLGKAVGSMSKALVTASAAIKTAGVMAGFTTLGSAIALAVVAGFAGAGIGVLLQNQLNDIVDSNIKNIKDKTNVFEKSEAGSEASTESALDTALSINNSLATVRKLEDSALEATKAMIDTELARRTEDTGFFNRLGQTMSPVVSALEKAADTLEAESKRRDNLNSAEPIKRASGGAVNGPGTGTSDDIPAMLSNGEYVMQQSAVQKFGPDFMAKVNAGIMPTFRSGGGAIGDVLQGAAAAGSGLAKLFEGETVSSALAMLTKTNEEDINVQVGSFVPELVPVMNQPMTSPSTVAAIEDITGANLLTNPNGLVDYVTSRAMLTAGEMAYKEQGGIVPLMSLLLDKIGLALPAYPQTLSEILPFAMESLKLASGVGNFFGNQAVIKAKPKITAVDDWLLSMSDKDQRSAMGDAFYKDGITQFPKGALLGGAGGVAATAVGSVFKVIKGLGKTLASAASGDLKGAGMAALGTTGHLARTILGGGLIGAAVNGAIGSMVGGSAFTLSGMVDSLFNRSGGFDASGIDTGFRLTGQGKQDSDNDIRKYNMGGAVNGPGTGTSDDIPAMLSNGEFVMRQSAVQKFGPDFMAKVNAGVMPQFRSQGGAIGRAIGGIRQAEQRGDYVQAERLRVALQDLYKITEAQVGVLKEQGVESKAGTDIVKEIDKAKAARETAEAYAADVQANFQSAFTNVLATGDIKGFFESIADNFTMNIIDSFSKSFTDNLFGDNSLFESIFKGQGEMGDSAGSKVGGPLKALFGGGKEGEAAGEDKSTKAIGGIFDGAKEWMSGLFGEGGGLSGIFEGFSGGLSGIFSSLGGSLGSLFGGGAEGGGGLGSLLSMGLGFLGFSQGGTVPSTPFSQAGKDSVPAMLMPGEVVLSKNDVSRMGNKESGSTQAFNINVQGDVSRQTRKEIVKMMPQIAGGVNMQNKENNYRR
jgi:tape measure domain-containing protein